MKKKLLLIAVIVVTIVGAGAATALHYKNYQNKKNAEDTKIAAGVADIERQKDAQVKAREAELVAKANANRIGCEKGRALYEKLPVSVKRTVIAAEVPTECTTEVL